MASIFATPKSPSFTTPYLFKNIFFDLKTCLRIVTSFEKWIIPVILNFYEGFYDHEHALKPKLFERTSQVSIDKNIYWISICKISCFIPVNLPDLH